MPRSDGTPAATPPAARKLFGSSGADATAPVPGETTSAERTALESQVTRLQQEMALLQKRVPEEKRAAYQQGLEAGESNGAARWNEAMQRSARAVAEIAQFKPRLRREVESDAVRLAIAIARKILHRELSVDPAAITGMVRVAFDKVNARDVVRVRVSSQDHSAFRQAAGLAGLPDRVEVNADASLERGSIVIETSQGQLDASVMTQFEEIERGLADALERNSG
jgi:flagellar assembly protein FliH